MFLFFKDQHSNNNIYQGKIPYAHITTRLEDVYYDCNRVRVEYTIIEEENTILFKFFTDQSMAHFKNFLVSLDQGQQWQDSSGEYFLTKDKNKEVELWVTPVNMYGRPGVITGIHVSFP
jgi:membrane-bound inhibitor of C-type lysozyme